MYLIGLTPVVHAALSSVQKTDSSESDKKTIHIADKLYGENEVDQLYEHLKLYEDSNNSEIIWRLARATCDKAKSTSDPALRKKLMYEAFGYAEKALSLGKDINFACHKWYAIMLDYVGEYEATKERISKAYQIREHFLKAIELNPKDATSVHLLGYWCFVFADMPWYQQKIAAVVFATPPSSTYEESLKYFLEAEKIDPGFYSMNLLMIGKTFLRLKETEQAKQYLMKAKDYAIRTADDKKAHQEATELLQKLK